jgi:16S rRNA processing protein RimM
VLNLRRPAVQGTPFADAVPYRVAESRQAGDGSLYLKFDGFDTPEAAKTLKGMEIVVPRAAAAPLAPNEFYIEDLKGLIVIDSKGAQIGVIENVIEGGGGELVEVVLENGVRRLVPFRKEFFGDISLGQGSAVLTALWVLE